MYTMGRYILRTAMRKIRARKEGLFEKLMREHKEQADELAVERVAECSPREHNTAT